jgi:arabinogalactan oligomer/maltooligosaccharide transport system permease protein
MAITEPQPVGPGPAQVTIEGPGYTGGQKPPPVTTLKGRRWWAEVGWRHIVAVVALVWALVPVLYLVSAALNPLGTLSSSHLIPNQVSLENFGDLFGNPNLPFPRWALNTVIVCVVVTLTQLLFSAMAAYAFSRFRFRGRRGGLLALLLIQLFPQILAAVALFTMVTEMGKAVPAIGLNTIPGYILVLLGGALGQVWLIKGFFDSVPISLDEAAKIDGASHVQTFFRIILPLVQPILAISGLLVFIATISEFLLASLLLTDQNKKTIAPGLYGLIDADRSGNLGVFCAGSVLVALPVVALFLYLQRYIVGGITAGGVKG